ncbi:Bacteriohemerythrin [Ephemeroptericola cinctiostellae]|uniref:Bacteriohemerythrin n=1 Tax=Ephemeroptericola cinctiostellae TaxID=2268024 RepID=A0A345DDQ9_9BURK|nr:hemerythrin domain-containing protein [Ephemeroptericola cinctiostellae]AXF86497.1 Bacteriohemerythrin [Ephemeroptericola cinctiostellae]
MSEVTAETETMVEAAHDVAGDVMVWDDEMVLGNTALDQTHQEFVDILNRLAKTPEVDLVSVLDEAIAHTQAHFDLEEGWMARLSFPAAGCHVSEHTQVIGVMRMVRERVAAGETHFAYVLATELSAWLRIHATTMDYALTYFIESTHADLSTSSQGDAKPVGSGCGCG